MPSIPLHVVPKDTVSRVRNPLPELLQTPAGLAILEIQGSINLPPATPSTSTTPIGRLDFPEHHSNTANDSWMKRVHLYVGQHQRLTGEVKKLPNPVAVIRKRETDPGQGDELEIAEIVYYKIIFSSRPEPVGT
ncbi:chromosome transmission fidelity protein 8, partial [Lecanoromycetidae sp. Uapishka_2]